MITGAYVMVTNRCNFNCSYCYESDRIGDMKWETMKQLIDMMVEQYEPNHHTNVWADLSVSLFGGEPLFNWPVVKKTLEYVEEIRKEKNVKFYITILTNGSIWNEEMNDFLMKYKAKMRRRLKMQVSLDGCEESHDANRTTVDGKGTFKTVVENIKKYRQIIPDIQVRETLVPANISKFFEDYKLLSSLTEIVQMSPIIEDNWTGKIDEAREQIKKIYELYFEQLKINPRRYLSLINGVIQAASEKGTCAYSIRDPKGCHAGYELIGVTIDGDIYPCHRFIAYRKEFDYKIGDVWKGVDETSQAFKDVREAHVANKECLACKSYTCIRCYAMNKHISGQAESSPVTGYCDFCKMNQELVDPLSDRLFVEHDDTLNPWSCYKSPTSKRRGIVMGQGEKILGTDTEDIVVQSMSILLKTMMEVRDQNASILKYLAKIADTCSGEHIHTDATVAK